MSLSRGNIEIFRRSAGYGVHGTTIAFHSFSPCECVAKSGPPMTQRSDPSVIASYANFLVVGHNAFEVILEFGQVYEGNDEPHMHTRIVTTPAYAKAMLQTLRTSIERFEATHGPIPDAMEQEQ